MQVKLISITNPLVKTEDDSRFLSPEELIVFCARVSNASNQLNIETSPKLLNFCIKNGHWSIFEQVNFSVEIKTSRAIAQQILRHRSFSFQEFSQRYSVVSDFEPMVFRLQGKTNRQTSDEKAVLNAEINYQISLLESQTKKVYQLLIDNNVAKECARMILPLNAQTTLYMNGTVRSWIHYLQVRCQEHTQKEHRLIAYKIKDIFVDLFPNVSLSLGWKTNNL